MFVAGIVRFKKLATGEKRYKPQLSDNGHIRNTRRALKRASEAEHYGARLVQRFESIKSVSAETARSDDGRN